MEFAEFYLCFHNSCEIWNDVYFLRLPYEIVFGVITADN